MSRSARRADGARGGVFRDAAALDAALAALPSDAFVKDVSGRQLAENLLATLPGEHAARPA